MRPNNDFGPSPGGHVAPILSLSCLGTPQAVSESGEHVRFRTRKHLALLIRLAVEPGKRFTRDYLTELLWPGASSRLANHSLAQGLSVIRSKVGRESVLVQRATVALAEGAVDVDVLHLDNGNAEIRGSFLEGFELPAARPFEDWTNEWRAKLSPRLRDVLVGRMDGARRIGDFAAVERFAVALHELEPLCEDAIRGMIEARAWVGDRTSALKVYSAYASRLAEDLGAKPSADLERMADLLREGRRNGPKPASVAEPSGRAERRFEAEVVIGREREFSVLYDAWLAARRRNPAIVVLTGDAGLGKTTLTNAFVSNCQLEGAVVARAQAYDAERELPFAVLAELVRQLAMQRAIGSADPEALSELSRLTPEVRNQYPGVPKPTEWAAEIVPLRLADAFLKTVAAAAEESPVVLVVDDLHAADNASAAILHLVARKLPASRLFMIWAARSAELRAGGTPAALATDPLISALRPLELEPLSDNAAARLVESVQQSALASDAGLPRHRLLSAGRGNPLALELLTREWIAHGPESLIRDLEAMDTQPAAAIGMPRAIKLVFDRQVRRLSRQTRAVLDLAAILGRRLDNLHLYRAVDCNPKQAADALARLRDGGFVREVHGTIEFRNELIRGQAYYAIPLAGRQHLHRGVAELLEVEVDGNGYLSIETSWHYIRGGDISRATTAAMRGAELSLRHGAPREAEQILTALVDENGDPAVAKRIRVLLCHALLNQSKAAEAVPLLKQVLSDPSLSPVSRSEVKSLHAAAEYLLNRESGRDHFQAAEEAYLMARTAGELRLTVRSLFEYARGGAESGKESVVKDVLIELETLMQTNEEAPLSPLAHLAVGYCRWFFDELEIAESHLVRALELDPKNLEVAQRSCCYGGLTVVRFLLGKVELAEQASERLMELAKKVGDDSRASVAALNLCAAKTARRDYSGAMRYGELSVELGERSGSQPFLVAAYTNLVDVHLLLGNRDKALDCYAKARDWALADRSWFVRTTFLMQTAGLALAMDNKGLALKSIVELEGAARDRERALSNRGLYNGLRAFRIAHECGFDDAMVATEAALEQLRNRNPLLYLETLAAKAWLETQTLGRPCEKTEDDLRLFDLLGIPGRRDLLVIEGFLGT